MTDSFVTQCPQCRTSFRISRAQLGAASGVVRCGACMHVFNAARQMLVDQNRVRSTPQPTTPPAKTGAANPAPRAAPSPAPRFPVAPATPPKQADDTLWIHDDLDLDNLDLDEELAKLEQQELEISQEFMALKPAPKPSEELLEPLEQSGDRTDESWAERLLNEEKVQSQAPSPATAPAVVSTNVPQDAADSETETADADDELVWGERQAAAHEPTSIGERRPDELSALANIDTSDADVPDDPTLDGERRDTRRGEGLFELDEEPLRLDWQERKKPWGRWFGWGTLNLIVALALGAQYVAYHFDELARQDSYRPWFERLCPSLGCTLPSKVDIEQIKSSNLVVRSHPDFSGALVVDAILYNRAAFAQPFPLLELRFADLNDQTLASRRFKPSEYLGGELAGQTEMPPQTPIHISLDILDPGDKAVNYSLVFHSPE
jgi:predicted Zn finger-like uncharacterized protein